MNRFARRAKGTPRSRRKYGEMTRVEQSYQALLAAQLRAGKIQAFAYEAIKIRLADRTYYTPDFMLLNLDDTLEFHETKGAKNKEGGGQTYWAEEDAKLKVKMAAEIFPAKFCIMWPLKDGNWGCEEF